MASDPLLPRRHYFEITDQAWFPLFLREKVQDFLTLGWINRFPILQATTPAALVANLLPSVLGARVSDYVYVDFASGAGGPTPHIERHLNHVLRDQHKDPVDFLLTDISPHVHAWEAIAKKSGHIAYVADSVDATNAPPAAVLLQDIPGARGKKVMRLFSLAFHHFDDDLAADILENTVETSDGFCIFELQSRHWTSFVLISLLWPLAMLVTPFYFWHSPSHLFFTYLVPIVPWVWVYDGYISCLRTRTPGEVQRLFERRVPADRRDGWQFRHGRVCHTWPIGHLNWIICYRA